MLRRHFRGAIAGWVVVALVVLGLLAGAGFLFFKKGLGGLAGLGGSAFDLAKYLPEDSRVAMMFKLTGQLDPGQIQGDLEEVMAKIPAEKREKFTQDMQKELGAPLPELVKFFDGRAALAVLDSPKPMVMALVGLRDAEGLEKYLASKNASAKTEKFQEITFRLGVGGQYYGHDSTWLYFGDSKEAAELAVRSAAGGNGLDKVPSFVEARGKVRGGSSLAGFYLDLPGLLKSAQTHKPPGTDEGTFKGMACLGYMAGSYDFKSKESYGFLKVNQDDSQLAQKLLAKGGVSAATLSGVAKELSYCQALDAEWTFNTVVALMTLFPEARQQAAMASVGLMVAGNPWTAFEGELALATDVLEETSSSFTSTFSKASGSQSAPQPSVVVCAPVKDIELAHKLLAKAIPDAGDTPKAGTEKVYSVPMSELKMKTDAPARLTFNYGPKGQAMADLSKGTLADQPEVKAVLDWGGDGLVQVDFVDLNALLEKVKGAVPKDDPEAEAVLAGFEKLKEFGLRGSSGIAVRADGLEYRCVGIGAAPLLGVGAAIMVPNFTKARSQGQLTACKSNQKNIATALEMYSTDYAGAYPKSMNQLTPNYLKTIPSCPVAGTDTYSSSYSLKKSDNGDYQIYEVFCSGANHVQSAVPENYPRYNGDVGIIEQP